MVRHPMDEVREAVASGEVTASDIARESGRTPQTVGKAIRHEIDTPESTSKLYLAALETIRANRKAGAAA